MKCYRLITLLSAVSIVLCLLVSVTCFAQEEITPEALSVESGIDAFTYNPAGRRDPFAPLVDQMKKTDRVPVSKPRGPLQKYELTQFRLMALLVVDGRPMAMVKAPDGKSYPVKVGDEIGRYEGKVVSIETKVTEKDSFGKRIEKSPDRIVVKEIVRDTFSGKETVEYRHLTM